MDILELIRSHVESLPQRSSLLIGPLGYPLKAGQFKSFTPRMIKPKGR